jgi:hypothetical protein
MILEQLSDNGGKQLDFLNQCSQDALYSKSIYAQHGVKSTDHFIGLGLMGTNGTIDRILEVLKSLPDDSTTEWMVHPGYQQIEGGDWFSQSAERTWELSNLLNDDLKRVITKEFGFRIISWSELK